MIHRRNSPTARMVSSCFSWDCKFNDKDVSSSDFEFQILKRDQELFRFRRKLWTLFLSFLLFGAQVGRFKFRNLCDRFQAVVGGIFVFGLRPSHSPEVVVALNNNDSLPIFLIMY